MMTCCPVCVDESQRPAVRLSGHLESNPSRFLTDHKSLKHVGNVADHNQSSGAVVARIPQQLRYTVTYRKARVVHTTTQICCRVCLSLRRNTAAPGRSVSILLTRQAHTFATSCGRLAQASQTPGVVWDGLVKPAFDARWDVLPLAAEDLDSKDFQFFRAHGPRMKVAKLYTPGGSSAARASPAGSVFSASSTQLSVTCHRQPWS